MFLTGFPSGFRLCPDELIYHFDRVIKRCHGAIHESLVLLGALLFLLPRRAALNHELLGALGIPLPARLGLRQSLICLGPEFSSRADFLPCAHRWIIFLLYFLFPTADSSH